MGIEWLISSCRIERRRSWQICDALAARVCAEQHIGAGLLAVGKDCLQAWRTLRMVTAVKRPDCLPRIASARTMVYEESIW